MTGSYTVREARPDDESAIQAMTADTWPDRETDDYLSRVYTEWIEPDDRPKRTLVVDHDGDAVAIAQAVCLSDHEAWGQGLRVHPDHRGEGLSTRLTQQLFEWARDAGARVVRGMVFSWNVAGLGQARASGYRPVCGIRWIHPRPTTDSTARDRLAGADQPWIPNPGTVTVTHDPDLAWSGYHGTDAGAAMAGLAISPHESWALQELTRDLLHTAARDRTVIAATTPAGVAGMSHRVRTFERERDDGATDTVAEYGIAAWADLAAGAAVLDAISRDAADLGADRIRVLVPERGRYLADAAYLGCELGDHPDYVMAADLV